MPGASAMDKRSHGESRGTEASLAGLWAFPWALPFAQSNVDQAGIQAEEKLAEHRLISGCEGQRKEHRSQFRALIQVRGTQGSHSTSGRL